MNLRHYNVITKYAGTAAKHRNVTKVAEFLQYMEREFDAHTAFFYDAKTLVYVGYWKRGKTYRVHN